MDVTLVSDVWELAIDDLPDWPHWYRALGEMDGGRRWYGYATRRYGIVSVLIMRQEREGERWAISFSQHPGPLVAEVLDTALAMNPSWTGSTSKELLGEIKRLLTTDPVHLAAIKRE